MLYIKGYNGQLVSREVLDKAMSKIHPLVKPRFWNLIDASDATVGVGESFRNDDAILAEFLRRHVIDPKGAISYDGERWTLKPGYAPLAPPGRTYHGATLDGFCFAADLVGNLAFAEANCARFGLRSFKYVGTKPEPWHFQPIEIPTAKAGYSPLLHPLKDWNPVTTPPAPDFSQEEGMIVVVNMVDAAGNPADDVNPNRRWTWNGVGADLLLNEGEFTRLKTIFKFHPFWDELAKPFGLTKAEIVRYGGEV